MDFYRPGEVVLLAFPFTDKAGTRKRPALVLLDTGDADIVVARVTTQPPQADFDVGLADWKQAGLFLPSAVRLHKLATIAKRLIERRVGVLTPADWARVQTRLQELWISQTRQQK